MAVAETGLLLVMNLQSGAMAAFIVMVIVVIRMETGRGESLGAGIAVPKRTEHEAETTLNEGRSKRCSCRKSATYSRGPARSMLLLSNFSVFVGCLSGAVWGIFCSVSQFDEWSLEPLLSHCNFETCRPWQKDVTFEGDPSRRGTKPPF